MRTRYREARWAEQLAEAHERAEAVKLLNPALGERCLEALAALRSRQLPLAALPAVMVYGGLLAVGAVLLLAPQRLQPNAAAELCGFNRGDRANRGFSARAMLHARPAVMQSLVASAGLSEEEALQRIAIS